jgi:hypothetical protein
MPLFLKKRRRDRVQQLRLNLASDEKIALDTSGERQLVEVMAAMLLAVVLAGKETGDDHHAS